MPAPAAASVLHATHWDGLDKSGGADGAVDGKKFEGDIISQRMSSRDFFKMNSKARWKKMPGHRVNKPGCADRSVFEDLANALMHRGYTAIGSKAHVDMLDGRLEICSPGGTLTQNREIEYAASTRQNPIVAEISIGLSSLSAAAAASRKSRTRLPSFMAIRTISRQSLSRLYRRFMPFWKT
jgi:predicted HTH transcriptional regulator